MLSLVPGMTTIKRIAAFLAVCAVFWTGFRLRPRTPAGPRSQSAAPRASVRSKSPFSFPAGARSPKGAIVEGVAVLRGLRPSAWRRPCTKTSLGNEAYLLYKAAATREDAVRYRAETETRDARRNQLLLAGAAVWALNLLDIALIVRGKARGRQNPFAQDRT